MKHEQDKTVDGLAQEAMVAYAALEKWFDEYYGKNDANFSSIVQAVSLVSLSRCAFLIVSSAYDHEKHEVDMEEAESAMRNWMEEQTEKAMTLMREGAANWVKGKEVKVEF